MTAINCWVDRLAMADVHSVHTAMWWSEEGQGFDSQSVLLVLLRMFSFLFENQIKLKYCHAALNPLERMACNADSVFFFFGNQLIAEVLQCGLESFREIGM